MVKTILEFSDTPSAEAETVVSVTVAVGVICDSIVSFLFFLYKRFDEPWKLKKKFLSSPDEQGFLFFSMYYRS